MDGILNFLADYYILFIILSVILLFALIGFIVGERKKNKAGVQTASATDLPINNTDTPVQNPNVTIAPEAPVMMSEPVNSEPVQMETPIVSEPVSQDVVVPVTPEVNVQNEPTLVIDEPVQPTNVAPVEAPVMMSEPATNEPVQMSEPVVSEPVTQDVVVPTTPEVQSEPVITNNGMDANTIIPDTTVEAPVQDNNIVLEPTISSEDVNTIEPSSVMPQTTENVLEPTTQEQNTNDNSIFENPDMTGTTSIFENEVNNQNN